MRFCSLASGQKKKDKEFKIMSLTPGKNPTKNQLHL
jgi:hypothetical protein